jgi:hypothetical protein
MKILSEKEEIFVNLQMDMTDEEEKTLLEYADEHIPENEIKRFFIEWAFIECLKNGLESYKPKNRKKKK